MRAYALRQLRPICFVLSFGACSIVSPSKGEIYLLSSLDGAPLPGNLETPIVGGHLFGLQLVRSVLTVHPSVAGSSGRMSIESEGWVVQDSVPIAPYEHTISGPFERNDSTIVFRYDNPWGFVLHYGIREQGRVIWTREEFAPGYFATYVYERVDR